MTAAEPPSDAPEQPRPFWSVMIPTYEPGEYLQTALAGVLAQDLGPAEMQIEVLDDASPRTDVAAAVRRIAGDRVAVHRHPANVGLARNWNECIRRATGQVVHILHQDDIIRPGFYAALRPAFEGSAPAGAAFCRYSFIDGKGRPITESSRIRETAGVIDGWLPQIASYQSMACSSVVVRRDVYEAIGGYRSDLFFTLDWEMWVRIAARYPYWFEPAVLCGFRDHSGSESSRLMRSAETVRDLVRCVDILQAHLPPPLRKSCRRKGRWFCALGGLNATYRLARDGHYLPAAKTFYQSFRIDPVQATRRVLAWVAKVPPRALTRLQTAALPASGGPP